MPSPLPDPIREACILAAERLGLTPLQVVPLCPDGPDRSTVHRYLTRRCSLTTKNAAPILAALGLTVGPARD